MKTFIPFFIIVALSIFIISCDEDSNKIIGIGINSKVSECGGFDKTKSIVKTLDEETTCNDMLNWSYNSETKVLSLQNDNVGLNCCGIHSITAEKKDNKYIVTEIDKSENGARCNCMCTFSFAIEIPNVDSQSISLVLKRDIEENDEIETPLEETTIDLTQNSGTIIVKEQTGFVCGGK